MLVRLLAALAALSVLAPGTLLAAQIYVAQGELPSGLEAANVRHLPGLTLVVTEDSDSEAASPHLRRLTAPPGTEVFLVEAPEPGDRVALELHSTLLAHEGQFAIVAATPKQHRQLDVLRYRKERLVHTPRLRSTVLPTVGKRRVDAQVKSDLVADVDENRLSIITRELSGGLFFTLDGILRSNNNRYTHSVKHHIAADYLEERFETSGYTVVRQNFTASGTPTQNIIAVKTGTVSPDQIVVVGGHYDSTSESTSISAPGAEDNGSGTAGVLHLAEVFADYETEVTIHFVAFGGEEQGLYGSQHYVNQAIANGDNVVGALTMDMISAWNFNYKVIIEGETAWESLMSAFESNVVSEAQIGYRKDYFSFGSDHVPFQNAGIPSLLAIDWDYGSYADYHRTTDTWDKLDFTLGTRIVMAMAGTLADLTNPSLATTAATPIPNRLQLEQNAPNPFNPSTTIVFALPDAGRVRVDVYDLKGRHVSSLYDAAHAAGPGEVTWNGVNADQTPMPSGVYVYRLRTPWGEQTKRMVLIQ